MKLELLANATVVNDVIRFASNRQAKEIEEEKGETAARTIEEEPTTKNQFFKVFAFDRQIKNPLYIIKNLFVSINHNTMSFMSDDNYYEKTVDIIFGRWKSQIV
jgi:hypothetical protein